VCDPKFVGPPTSQWLDALRHAGARIQDSLPGDVLLVGLMPDALAQIRTFPWVEQGTPYRPAMKISPRFRRPAAGTERHAYICMVVHVVRYRKASTRSQFLTILH
jgi:hypothetical protein